MSLGPSRELDYSDRDMPDVMVCPTWATFLTSWPLPACTKACGETFTSAGAGPLQTGATVGGLFLVPCFSAAQSHSME